MKNLISYFIRGIVFLAPLALTTLLFFNIFNWVLSLLTEWHIDHFTMLIALGISLIIITAIGFLASTIILRPFSEFFNKIIKRIPVLNFVYASLKDMTNALVGDKNKFNNPVLIKMGGEGSSIHRLGFLTQDGLPDMGMEDMVTVFVPISYSYTGNMYVVPRDQVQAVDVPAVDVFKMIFTGGVTTSDKAVEVAEKK